MIFDGPKKIGRINKIKFFVRELGIPPGSFHLTCFYSFIVVICFHIITICLTQKLYASLLFYIYIYSKKSSGIGELGLMFNFRFNNAT